MLGEAMPPSKVKIERITDDRTRQNTFHKRKLGLIKKVRPRCMPNARRTIAIATTRF